MVTFLMTFLLKKFTSTVMDDWNFDDFHAIQILNQNLVYSALCNEMMSWMIETWMENHLVRDNNCNLCRSIVPNMFLQRNDKQS